MCCLTVILYPIALSPRIAEHAVIHDSLDSFNAFYVNKYIDSQSCNSKVNDFKKVGKRVSTEVNDVFLK